MAQDTTDPLADEAAFQRRWQEQEEANRAAYRGGRPNDVVLDEDPADA